MKESEVTIYNAKINFIQKVLYIVFFVILARFFFLQVIQGDIYRSLADGNTKQKYYISPPRGIIYDRRGRILASNKASYELSIVVPFLSSKKSLREKQILDISKRFRVPLKDLQKVVKTHRRNYRSISIQDSLNKDEIIYIEENKEKYPFLIIGEYSGRYYPLGASIGHLLGYIGMINSREYGRLKNEGYDRNSFIGKSGIEKAYDRILRGEEGVNIKIVNTLGVPISEVEDEYIAPIPGKNIILSIDSELQRIAYHALQGRKGGIIISKAKSGEILALVSSPSFNPNDFLDPLRRGSFFRKNLNNENKPFLNRVLQGLYAPGSIFKIITALSALEDKVIDPQKVVDTSRGYFKLNKQIWKDHKLHKEADMVSAIQYSNNVYFYLLANSLGYSSILEHSRNLGLSNYSGIDLPDELHNLIPTMAWKEEKFHQPWSDGDTINVSIGQGFLLLNPISVHRIISFIAAGNLVRPRIVWKVQNPYSGSDEKFYPVEIDSNYHLNANNLAIIRQGLAKVVSEGTGVFHNYLSPVKIAAKSGSAQTSKGQAHGWFVSYGPLNRPLEEQYVMTVLVENSNWGSSVALPVSSILWNYLAGVSDREKTMQQLNRVINIPVRGD